jgi:hypothetical protein
MKINHLDHMLIVNFWLFISSLPLVFFSYFILEYTLGFWLIVILNENVLSYFMTTHGFRLIGFLNQQGIDICVKIDPLQTKLFCW